jgi:Tfp pilus assembly protein PilV
MKTTPDRTAGFTLLEVLVAFVILTMVVTLCLQVFSSSARTEASARWSEEAHDLLRDRIASFETLGLRPGQQVNGVAADGMRWALAVALPSGAGDSATSGRGVIWVTASVTDPSGRTYTASTARWSGEAFAEVEQ